MRDLIQCDQGDQSPQAIKTLRKQTEERLDTHLQRARSVVSAEKVMALVFESDAPEFRTFVAAMLSALHCESVDRADEVVLEVIQDAWNYFPHRSLNGLCPAEIMASSRLV